MSKIIFTLVFMATAFIVNAQSADPWSEYMTPSAVHKFLAEYVGDFEMEITMWMAEGQEPLIVKVNSVNNTLLGGRFLEMKQSGKMMGMDYQAIMTLGFNTIEKKFALTTVTNMGTGTLSLNGPWDEQTQIATLKGQITNPVTKNTINVRQQVTFSDKDTLLVENFDQEGSGPEKKTIQYRLVRVK